MSAIDDRPHILHISDVAVAFTKAVSYSGEKSVFNVGAGHGTSLNELLDLLEEVLDTKIVRYYLPGRSFDVPISVLNNTFAAQELGWKPQVSLKDGLTRIAAWMKNTLGK